MTQTKKFETHDSPAFVLNGTITGELRFGQQYVQVRGMFWSLDIEV